MRKITVEEWLARFDAKFGNKFDYSEAEIKTDRLPIKIICREHGEFWQTPQCHTNSIHGCNLCSPTCGAKLTKNQLINKFKKKHGEKYIYDQIIFKGIKKQITIICRIHGEFKQIAENHFISGCQACAGNRPLTFNEFRDRSRNIFNWFYDYTEVEKDWDKISANNDKIKIWCPKHGYFLQTFHGHLTGRCCMYCRNGNSSKKERKWLDYIGIPNDFRNKKIKFGNKFYVVDGYIPNSNIIFEFLGDFWHGNPSIYDFRKKNKKNKKMFKKLFEETVSKIRLMRSFGYKVITIWEKDFDRKLKQGKLNYEKFGYCGKSDKSA